MTQPTVHLIDLQGITLCKMPEQVLAIYTLDANQWRYRREEALNKLSRDGLAAAAVCLS